MTKLWYRAVFRAGYNVAVTCVVALTPEQHFLLGIVTKKRNSSQMMTWRGRWPPHSGQRWSGRSWRSRQRRRGTSCPRTRQQSQTLQNKSFDMWRFWSFETNCKAKVGNVYKESGGFRSWRTSTRFTLQGVKFPKSPAVDSGNEAVRLHPNLLREVVPEMPPGLLARAVCHDGQDGVHRERKVHRAWPLLRIGRGLCWCWWWGGRLSLWKRKPLLGLSSALASVALSS